jgi:hypothetical protein
MPVGLSAMSPGDIATCLRLMKATRRPLMALAYETSEALHCSIHGAEMNPIDAWFLRGWVRAILLGHESVCDICVRQVYPNTLMLIRPDVRSKRGILIPGMVVEICSLCIAPEATLCNRIMEQILVFGDTDLVARSSDGAVVQRSHMH